MKNFEQIINLLEDARHYYVICTDMTGNYSYINNNYAERFRHVNENFVGQSFHITMHPDDIAAVTAGGTKSLMEPDALVPVMIRKRDGNGGYVITQWEFKGMFDDNGMPTGVFCLGYDITTFISELAKKDVLLDDIAFSQSHVIRKPVANIMGVVNLLKDSGLTPEVSELLEILSQNVLELDAIIRSIAADVRR